MKRLVVVVGIITLILTGCSSNKTWYTATGYASSGGGQWQIHGIQSTADTKEKFELQLGVESRSKDYSYWFNSLHWQNISLLTVEQQYGDHANMIIPKGDYEIYQLTLPNTVDFVMPSTRVTYDQGDTTKIVNSILYLKNGNDEECIIFANKKIMWTGTSADPNSHVVTLTWQSM